MFWWILKDLCDAISTKFVFVCDAISTKFSTEFVRQTLTIFRRGGSFESASETRAPKKYSERDHIVAERVSITELL